MASIFKLLSLTLFLALVFQAYGHCSLRDISIKQHRTSNYAHGMPEWSVNITNNCVCSQSHVKFNCVGFQTYESIDPSIMMVSGDECLLKNGTPIFASESVNFFYAWEPKFTFQPMSSEIASCS